MDSITNNAEQQREKRRTYMREYKRRKYAENADLIKEQQRIYYHARKNKSITPSTVISQFPIVPVEFTKLLIKMDKLKESNPDALYSFMNEYIGNNWDV